MKNWRKITALVLLSITMLFAEKAKAQEENQECTLRYSEFRSLYSGKKYAEAYEPWLWTFENCPTLSINIYKNGIKIAKYRYEHSEGAEKEAAKDLVARVYEQRLKYYPNEKPAKMYSEYAMFMDKAGADEETVFNLLQKSYSIDPKQMGVKAIFKFFDGIILRNKDTNVQNIFDMYDNLLDVVNAKMTHLSKEVDKFREMEEAGQELSERQAYLKGAYSKNLTALGKIESVLSAKLEKYATCDRLIPMFEADFEANKTDLKWLKRSVSRLHHKGCTDSELYDRMVETYVNADPSADAYKFYAGLLMKKGNESKALEYFQKAEAMESDPYEKAKLLLFIAKIMKKKGRKSEARKYAYQALKARPSMGKAYLLIASLYASSAKSCSGGDAFTQRMIYQAAALKAMRAKAVDPGISSLASKYIKSYKAKAPSTQDVFEKGYQSGTPFKIGCWINETVNIP